MVVGVVVECTLVEKVVIVAHPEYPVSQSSTGCSVVLTHAGAGCKYKVRR